MSERDPAAHPPGEPDTTARPSDEATPLEPADRDDGPVRRPLIRATLKPPEGTPPPQRPAPVFTMHQQPRGGAGGGRGNSRSRANRPGRDNGHPNKMGGKSRSRSGRRGKGRSR